MISMSEALLRCLGMRGVHVRKHEIKSGEREIRRRGLARDS
jgi:hypothetical protein